MSERDYNKQVAKRQRIRSTSLVVGVDVGKAYNASGFMNKEGKVLGSWKARGSNLQNSATILSLRDDFLLRFN